PYNLRYFEKQENILVAYQDIDLNMEKAAQAVHKAIGVEGKLPVTVNNSFVYHQGVSYSADSSLLRYTVPESVGLKSEDFSAIDSAINYALKESVFPGCQVLVSIKGNVIYNKSFGYHDYSGMEPVKPQSIYDVASLTKI